jgi:hypothetical protein
LAKLTKTERYREPQKDMAVSLSEIALQHKVYYQREKQSIKWADFWPRRQTFAKGSHFKRTHLLAKLLLDELHRVKGRVPEELDKGKRVVDFPHIFEEILSIIDEDMPDLRPRGASRCQKAG